MNYRCIKSFTSIRNRDYSTHMIISQADYSALIFAEQRYFEQIPEFEEVEDLITVNGVIMTHQEAEKYFKEDEPYIK